jgi:hypothetical protein
MIEDADTTLREATHVIVDARIKLVHAFGAMEAFTKVTTFMDTPALAKIVDEYLVCRNNEIAAYEDLKSAYYEYLMEISA